MILIARIVSSDQADERVLELAPGVVELDEVELGLDDGAADVRAAILGGRQRERQAAALLVRIGDAGDAGDRREHAADLALGVVAARRPDGDRDLADLALRGREVLLA